MQTTGDRFVDLSLRILTLVVGGVLLACLGLLVYRWSVPPRAMNSVTIVPVTPVSGAPVDAQERTPEAVNAAEVLMAPGKMFQCIVDGRKLFSDRPCPEALPAKK